MGIFKRSKIQVVKEAYIGETKGIQEMQKHLSAFRSKYITKKFEFDENINLDKDLELFNRAAEKEFGFECFNLRIISSTTINAFTIPVSSRFDVHSSGNPDEMLEPGKMKFKKELGYCGLVWLYYGIFSNEKFTDREVMAIILHEVGHNFAHVMNGYIGILHTASKAVVFGIAIATVVPLLVVGGHTNAVYKSLNDYDKYLKDKHLGYILRYYWKNRGIIDSIRNEVNFISRLTNPIANVFNVIRGIGLKIVRDPINSVFDILLGLGYKEEVLSDNFSAIYGYGPEIASALGKFKTVHSSQLQNAIDAKIPYITQFLELTILPIEILTSVIKVHPLLSRRIDSVLEKLESELDKGNMDAKMEKRLRADIKQLYKEKEKYIKCRHDDPVKDPVAYSKAYNSLMDYMFKGDIKHYIFDTKIDDNMENHLKIKNKE